MWTSTVELNVRRVLLSRLFGRFWRGAYFSSLAPLQVQNLPRPSLPASSSGWVRVRNHLAGICGSDLHLVYRDGDLRIAPAAVPARHHLYPGHEVVGEVIEVDEDVRRLRVGDRVVLQSGPSCLSTGAQPPCRSCASGNYNLCENGNLPGPHPIGGGWSEEMLLSEQQLFRVPPELNDEQAVLLEPTAVAVHAVLRRLPRPGEQVLIIGAGTIGLLTLQVVRALAPQAHVSVLARHDFQIEQATRMGAEHIIYPQDSYSGIAKATGASLHSGMLGNTMLIGGYDIIFDTVGTHQTIHDSLRWARARGSVVLVGVSLHTMRLDLSPIWFQEVDLVGTMGHGAEIWPPNSGQHTSTFAVASALITGGHLHPEKLITHRFALNNYRTALTTASGKAHSRAIKVVFDYALMPASVVPNVRAARPQRQVRTTVDRADWQQSEAPASPVHSTPPPLPTTPEPERTPLARELLPHGLASTPAPNTGDDDESATVVVNRPRRQSHFPTPLSLRRTTEDVPAGPQPEVSFTTNQSGATNNPSQTLQHMEGTAASSESYTDGVRSTRSENESD